MPAHSPILILSNDLSLATSKTSRYLGNALERLGATAVIRDTRLVRWAVTHLEKKPAFRLEAYEKAVEIKWNKFISDYGITGIISLDLHWLFTSRLFLFSDQIKHINSFWFDDLRSHLQSAPMFPLSPHTALDLINEPKVTHHCYGHGQAEEMRLLGVNRIRRSALAAPAEFLEAREPCTERKRLAFIGNPGLPTLPSPKAVAAMERGARLRELRVLARRELLERLPQATPAAAWIQQTPTVFDLLAAAMEERISQGHTAAVDLLVQAGRAYPAAFAFINQGGFILDAAMLVKLVNRYDRPALAHRLWRRGWLDIYGAPEQWRPYGITAQPTVTFPRLTHIYQRYPAHLNAANCARDATANEKLFEIAACGRLSLNLDSPDLRACYAEGEILCVESEEALEASAEHLLRDPDAALAAGERARVRTAQAHLWDHRMREVLA